MTESLLNPEEILFTDREGRRGQLQDIIDEGLDGGYDERVPALVDLLTSGNPYHRLLACVMLTSWGHPKGFQMLIDWASKPDNVPWIEEPVVYDRISGTDNAFEMLADAVMTSYYCEEDRALKPLRTAAVKALLGLYHSRYFGRTLALAIMRDRQVAAAAESEIYSAIEASMAVLDQREQVGFDLVFQVASLLIPLASLNDQAAASYANQLIARYSQNQRMLSELANALGEGRGPDTLASLQHMKTLGIPALDHDIKSAIARRSAR